MDLLGLCLPSPLVGLCTFFVRRQFWRHRLLPLPRPEGSILQQARASPWYMPEWNFAACRAAIRRLHKWRVKTDVLWQSFRLPNTFLHIPGRCPIGLNLAGLLSLYLNALGPHNRISARSALECGRLRPLFVPCDGNAKRHCMDSSKAACTNYFTLREL